MINEQRFDLLARLSQSPILLVKTSGEVIQSANLGDYGLIEEDGSIAADHIETLKKHLEICARSLNLTTLSLIIKKKRFIIKGARFNPSEKEALVILYVIHNKEIAKGFNTLNQVADLSYEIQQHIAMEKRLLEQAAELQESREKIKELAHFDPVTKLPNRAFFQEILSSTLKHADRMKHRFAILFLDIDNFKHINDTYGHTMGDHVLVEVAHRIKTVARDMDYVSRLGGDEFTIILDLLKSYDSAKKFASRLNTVIAEPYQVNDIELYITCSIGISMYPDAGTTAEDLLKNSDAAMYECKSLGKNSFQFYTEKIHKKNLRYLTLENNLRHAIKNDELYMVYQPQFDITTNRIKGVEALLRWNSKSLGLISPDEFIPVAEKSGLMNPIGDWVIKQSLLEFTDWDKKYPHLSLSININCSILQLENKSFCNKVKETINFYKVSGTRIIFEATETILMERISEICDQLSYLNQLGIRLSIDDFGKGYSSLSYLKKLPIFSLKIDKSFVFGIPGDPNDLAIVKAIIQLAKSMNLEVIAEGVETQEQLDCLKELGCTCAQGFYLAKPLETAALLKLLKQHKH